MTARRRPHQVPTWEMPALLARRFHDGWREDAACREHDTLPAETWDDIAPGDMPGPPGKRQKRVAAAKKVCRTKCPVAAKCWADVDLQFDDGVRGGVDLRDVREALRRQQVGSAEYDRLVAAGVDPRAASVLVAKWAS